MKNNILLVTLMIITVPLFSQTTGNKAFKGIAIVGRIEGSKGGDTLEMYLEPGNLKEIIEQNFDFHLGISKLMELTNDLGEFSFKLPAFTALNNRVDLRLIKHGKEYVIINQALIYQKDNIRVLIKRKDSTLRITELGNGASRYECKRQMDSVIFGSYKRLVAQQDQHKVSIFPNALAKQHQQISGDAMQILKHFRQKIGEKSFGIMKADMMGWIQTWFFDKMFELYKSYNSKQRKEVSDIVKRLIITEKQTSQEAASQSIYYVGYLELLNKYAFQIKTNTLDSPLEDHALLKGLLENIIRDYKGILRDELMLEVMVNNVLIYKRPNDSTWEPYWEKAYNVFQNPVYKQYAWKRITFMQPGAEVIHFTFVDSNRQSVGLARFRGKIILLDIWYTGCPGCLTYANWLKDSIYPVFDRDTNLIIISISGDIQRDRWLTSVSAERYTRKENVNVYTGGLGFTHPFMKYYDFLGGPYAMLIDKEGKIISANLPRYQANLFIQVLRKALE